MSQIDITRRHRLGRDESRAVIQHIADSITRKFGVTPEWRGDSLQFARSGVDGCIEMSPGEVRVRARFGLLLTPLKPTVEAEIRRKLDEYFPATD